MMALFPTLKGAARPITTYHHIKHAPATSHKNQVNSYIYKLMVYVADLYTLVTSKLTSKYFMV